ncbi:type IV pilus modification protein PilV [Saccharospirillum alexandrii]|uniref:type IV pilus modification protein PilV n=1 Tax=Saccharospirillum alexandrii TaxID=2448477 RepID=UPI0013DE7B41|nr:type IV pilus modification protein PilV [Saccharospirillum alexandrii]
MRHLSGATQQGGIGLVEVLIAVLILAIGLLGLASMQTNGMRMTNGSMSRSQAVFLANDIVERARANRDNRADYALAPVAGGNVGACNLALAYNATLTVAQNDMAEWLNSLACLLPDADASIAFVSASNRMTVTVDWNRSANNVEDSVMVRTQL